MREFVRGGVGQNTWKDYPSRIEGLFYRVYEHAFQLNFSVMHKASGRAAIDVHQLRHPVRSMEAFDTLFSQHKYEWDLPAEKMDVKEGTRIIEWVKSHIVRRGSALSTRGMYSEVVL